MTTLRLLPQLEESLRQIPGIRAASVVTGPDARPTEVHVLSSRGKSAKQVVRDVQSLAMAQFDLDIDHRIVSVVQLDDGTIDAEVTPQIEPDDSYDAEPGAHGEDRPIRPLVDSVGVRTSNNGAEVTVSVRLGDDVFEGSVTGPALPAARPRLVARATLDALGELLGAASDVEHAAVLPVGGRLVAVSIVHVEQPRAGEQVLSGSAIVRGDEADAVARSVLDALNRRLAT